MEYRDEEEIAKKVKGPFKTGLKVDQVSHAGPVLSLEGKTEQRNSKILMEYSRDGEVYIKEHISVQISQC